MTSTADRLIYMANQIARNFEAIGNEAAAAATADHIASYWDPRMRERILSLAAMPINDLSPTAAKGITILSLAQAPGSQTLATQFAPADGTGHDDAG